MGSTLGFCIYECAVTDAVLLAPSPLGSIDVEPFEIFIHALSAVIRVIDRLHIQM